MIRLIQEVDENNKFSITKVEHTITQSDIDLSTLLEEIETFMRACGYSFTGTLTIEEE
jgi:hypothetical protein